MSAEPAISASGEYLYQRVLPLFDEDEEFGWFGRHLCDAIMSMMQGLDQIILDTDLNPGWTSIADPNTTPDAWIFWTAQLLGVGLPPNLTAEEQRELIVLHPAQNRATLNAMLLALRETLTGAKVVHVQERPGGQAYHIQFTTVTGETPSEAASLLALLSEKAGGLVLLYKALAAGTPLWNEATKEWHQVGGGVTWANVKEGDV
jgi:hypothetical protein